VGPQYLLQVLEVPRSVFGCAYYRLNRDTCSEKTVQYRPITVFEKSASSLADIKKRKPAHLRDNRSLRANR